MTIEMVNLPKEPSKLDITFSEKSYVDDSVIDKMHEDLGFDKMPQERALMDVLE